MNEPKSNADKEKCTVDNENRLAEAVPNAADDVDKENKLVKAVRDAGGHVPARYDMPLDGADIDQIERWRDEIHDLVGEVSFAFTMYNAWPEITKSQFGKPQRDTLKEIQGQLKRIEKRLSNQPFLTRRINAAMPVGYTHILEFISEFIRTAETLQKEPDDVAALPDISTNAQARLLQSLAEIYRRFFEADPRSDMNKTWNCFNGPFPAFVREALHIYYPKSDGKKISDEALTKAIERAFPE